jgi:hypothetical protein
MLSMTRLIPTLLFASAVLSLAWLDPAVGQAPRPPAKASDPRPPLFPSVTTTPAPAPVAPGGAMPPKPPLFPVSATTTGGIGQPAVTLPPVIVPETPAVLPTSPLPNGSNEKKDRTPNVVIPPQPYSPSTVPPYPITPPYNQGGYGGMPPSNQGYGSPDNYSKKRENGKADGEDGKILAAAGVVNDKGELAWPLGLRILPNKDAQQLCQQLEAMIRVLAKQTKEGQINPRLPGEIKDLVGQLEKLLQKDRDERASLTDNMYAEAQRFLTKLWSAARVMLALQPRDDANLYLPSAVQGRKGSAEY